MTLRSRRERSLALVAIVVFTTALVVVGQQAEAQVTIKTRAGEVSGPVFGTAVFQLPFAAQHLAVHWAGNPEANVTMETSTDGAVFSGAVDVGRDEVGEQKHDGESYGAVLSGRGATFVRLTSDKPLGRATVLALADGERVVTYEPGPARAGASVSRPSIKSRAEWQADESLRFNGKKEIWPTEFFPVQKTIVHHTAGDDGGANPEATIRSIYYYHAVTQRWGDIGYNFLISADGRIWKGRHSHPPGSQADTISGENASGHIVTAGHTYQHNAGTVGVVVLGTYTGATPSAAPWQSLVRMLAWEMDVHHLDPHGVSRYTNPSSGLVQENFPDIAGHRDASNNSTECPGEAFYADLPRLRDDVQAEITANLGNTTTSTSTIASTTTTTGRRGSK